MARDLGMGLARGLEGKGASPRLGSQAIAPAIAVVIRCRADGIGYEMGPGTVGVLSGNPPVGRRQLRPGVLAPQGEVSPVLGGVED